MITPIDVIDSAVKIGLGAIISGLATYWLTKANHDRALEKERAQRRIDLLESVALQVAAANQMVRKHWALALNWIEFTPVGEQMSDSARSELKTFNDHAADALRELVNAEARLSLVGEMKSLQLLREYEKYVKLFREESIEERVLTVDQMLEYWQQLDKKRESFFAELSTVYRKV